MGKLVEKKENVQNTSDKTRKKIHQKKSSKTLLHDIIKSQAIQPPSTSNNKFEKDSDVNEDSTKLCEDVDFETIEKKIFQGTANLKKFEHEENSLSKKAIKSTAVKNKITSDTAIRIHSDKKCKQIVTNKSLRLETTNKNVNLEASKKKRKSEESFHTGSTSTLPSKFKKESDKSKIVIKQSSAKNTKTSYVSNQIKDTDNYTSNKKSKKDHIDVVKQISTSEKKKPLYKKDCSESIQKPKHSSNNKKDSSITKLNSNILNKNKTDKCSKAASSGVKTKCYNAAVASNKTNKLIKTHNLKSKKSVHCAQSTSQPTPSKNTNKRTLDTADSDESDLEDVDELTQLLRDDQNSSEDKVVKIELEYSDPLWRAKKKKKRTQEEMFEEYLRKEYNRNIRHLHENMHKTHLLCLFAHGQHVNKALNSPTLMAAALSVVTNRNVYPPKRLTITHLQQFLKWFTRKITIKSDKKESNYNDIPLETILLERIGNKHAFCNKEFVFLFVILTRALGMNCRLVMSFRPLSWKPSQDVLLKPKKDENDEDESLYKDTKCLKNQMPDIKINNEDKLSPKKEHKLSNKILSTTKQNKSSIFKKTNKSNKTTRPKHKKIESDDSDFEEETTQFRKPQSKPDKKEKTNPRSKSDDKEKTNPQSRSEKNHKSNSISEWVEIFVEEEEKWVCVDVNREKLHCINEIKSRTPSPISYVIAFNGNLTVKDVTRRYVSNYLSFENKLRLDSEWWRMSIQGFLGISTHQDRLEDKQMDQNLQQQPLPKVVSEYKNHPMYALQRHLLKFEAIYPPDADPVGFFRGEPVFPRECVHILRGREYWIKEALVVKVGEEPYKIVKARPKWDKVNNVMIKDIPLELYGEWQVEDYEPPTAVDGRVPRNEYGNVELFKPRMIPNGCVHIQDRGAGFARLARRLGIDCVPAIVGFEFHRGGSHPINEGYVICKEFEDALSDAWRQEQINIAKNEEEKRMNRIYKNWKKLIQGMMVKVHVQQKYGISKPASSIKQKKSSAKKQIKQSDIDSQRPADDESSTSQLNCNKINLKIDTSMSAVDTMKQRLCEKKKLDIKPNLNISKQFPAKDKDFKTLSDSEDEHNPELHEQKVQQLFQQTQPCDPDLSDYSDDDSKVIDPSFQSGYKFKEENKSTNLNSSIHIKSKVNKLSLSSKKKQKINASERKELLDTNSEASLSGSSRSTTPEMITSTDKQARRSSRLTKNTKYVETENSDCDISFDDSDIDQDFVIKKVGVNRQSIDLSDESD